MRTWQSINFYFCLFISQVIDLVIYLWIFCFVFIFIFIDIVMNLSLIFYPFCIIFYLFLLTYCFSSIMWLYNF